MLRERAFGESLWEAVLPEELRELPPEPRKADELFDEERFLEPARRRLTAISLAVESAGCCAAEFRAFDEPGIREDGPRPLGARPGLE